MTHLSIQLLGGFEAHLSSNSPVNFPTKKAKALLAYLARNPGQRHSRVRLADLLWGKTGDAQARGNLRQNLSLLRTSLCHSDCACVVSEGDLLFIDSTKVDVDVTRFEDLCERATPEALEQASTVYEEEFLKGFELPEEAFEEWLRGERAQFREQYLKALMGLLTHYSTEYDPERGIRTALRLLSLDPLQEPVHRAVMQFYVAQGRRKSALRHYEDCRDILMKELGLMPDTETERLYQRIRRGDSSVLWVTPAGVPVADARAPTLPLPERPSVAIMPFRNSTGNPEDDYIADGIGLGIQTLLVQLSGLFLINAAWDENYRQGKVSATEAVGDLPVRYVIEGAVQRVGQRVRVNTQITDVRDKAVVWGEQYDRELEDIFALQDDITREVISSLRTEVLAGEDSRIWVGKLKSPNAWAYYLRGVSHFYKLTKEDNEFARQMFYRLYQEQPSAVHGPSFVAATHLFDMLRGWTDSPNESQKLAAEWAEKTLSYNENNGLGHAVLGHLRLKQGRHEEALSLCQKAVDYRCDCPLAVGELATAQIYNGDARGAVKTARKSLTLRMVYPPSLINVLAIAYRDNEQIRQSITAANEAVRLDPDNTDALVTLGTGYVLAGNHEQARKVSQKILDLDPAVCITSYARRHPYKDAKMNARLVEILQTAGLPA